MRRYFYVICAIVFTTLTFAAQAQNNMVTVSGKVVGKSDKQPLPGVVILTGKPLKGIAAVKADGTFEVRVPAKATLVFRMLGFKDHVVHLNGDYSLSIVMETKANELNEAVIVGYQKKTRETVTGSAVVISGEELQDVPVGNVMQLLQGKVPGLNIQNNNGMPGARGSLHLRGLSNISIQGSGQGAFLTPTSPLFVIDGVPVDPNTNFQYGFQQAGPGVSPLALIPQEDIASIEVLKDAKATALYGSRGAYGVILVTTKRGQSKVPIVRYTGNFFVNIPPKLRATIGGKNERTQRITEVLKNDSSLYDALESISLNPMLSDSLNPFYNNATDWQSVFYRPTYNQTHNISVSGGDQKFNYKVNLGYYNEKGIIENTGFERYSLRMNAQYYPSTKFKLFASISSSLGKQNKGSGNGLIQTGVASGSNSSSLLPPPSLFNSSSSVLSALQVDDDNKTANIKTDVQVRYEMLPGFFLGTTFSFDYTGGTEDRFTPAGISNGFANMYAYNDKRYTLYSRNTISYIKSFGDHNLNVNLFNELTASQFQASAALQDNLPNDIIKGPFGFDGMNSKGGVLDNRTQSRLVSFAGSVSYDYAKKYVLSMSYRLDGSSINGPAKPYSRNPSIGVRWNFYRENWFEQFHWLDYASLRGSWGRNVVPNGTIFDAYGSYNYEGQFNNKPTAGISFNLMPNTSLQPTTTTQLNGGFDLGLWGGKLQTSIDIYYKMVDNLLMAKPLAGMNGFDNINSNEASLVDYGYELALTFRPLPSHSKVDWSITFNGAINHDVLARLPDNQRQLKVKADDGSGQTILYRLGRNSLSNVVYDTRGIYTSDADVQVDPLTGLKYHVGSGSGATYFEGGDPRWTDINGDYILDERDLVVAGNSQPVIVGGGSSYLKYKDFTFTVNFSYTLIRDILNNALASRFRNYANPLGHGALLPIKQYDFWKEQGDVATYPSPYDYLRSGQVSPFRFNQTLFQEDGSYWKINSVILSYHLKRELTERWGMQGVRVYVSSNNVYTFTNYSGPNPENVTALGRDNSNGYPSSKSFAVGLNIEF